VLVRVCRWVLAHHGATFALTALLLVAAAAMVIRGGPLTSGTFEGTESARAQDLVAGVSGHPDEVTFTVLLRADDPDATQDDVARAMADALAPVRSDPRVAKVLTPEEAPTFLAPRMINEPARARAAFITMSGTEAEALESYADVREAIVAPGMEVIATGRLPFVHDMNETLERDLLRAELIALPLALFVLVLAFRTVVAAALPVAVGALAVLGAIGLVFGASHLTDVAMYAVNVCSLIGLGVSIDYSLFLVSRYREELDAGLPTDEAILRAVEKTGPTIAFSGLAVCVGLAGLLFFAGSYLLPMGVAGIVVVGLAVLFALTFLPALLSVLGSAIHRGRLGRARRSKDRRFWERVAYGVMKRPVPVGLVTLVALLAMGLPFLHIRLAAADIRVLDHRVEARRGYDLVREMLPDLARNRILVAVEFPTEPALTTTRIGALYDFAQRVRATSGVTSVESLFTGDETMGKDELEVYLLHPPEHLAPLIEQGKALTVGDRVAVLYALTEAMPESDEARAVVRAIRADRVVADGAAIVGGDTARDIDATEFIVSRAPHAVIFVLVSTLVLLFFAFRSVLLPIKAALMNLLSMAGSFGALVWIFQDGHLGVREPRPLEPTLPVLLFCVLFGLSMDYEVLLLSRIREAYRQTKNNREAVAAGMQRTASLITSAAAIMIAVFVAFAFADVVMIQAVGVGMAIAVALDATLVRTLLVPATMRLLGDLNWWAPKLPRFIFRRTRPA
jgi:RND superfamily putative drug exporter